MMAVRLLITGLAESLHYSNEIRPISFISRIKIRTQCVNSLLKHNRKFGIPPEKPYSTVSAWPITKIIVNNSLFLHVVTKVYKSSITWGSSSSRYAIGQHLYCSTMPLRTLSVGCNCFQSLLFEEKSSRYYSSFNGNGNGGSTKKPINKNLGLGKKQFVDHVLKKNQKKMRLTKLKLQKSGKMILKDIKESKSKMKEKMEEIIERENIWTIPNVLTVLRIAMSPFLGYLICQNDYELALGLVIFAGFTDLLDGYIARSFKNQASKLGSFLDPMADKVLIATLFLTLTITGNIPIPLTALIVARDTFLVGAGFYIRYQSLPPPKTLSRFLDVSHATAELAPTRISKLNTAVQLSTVFTTLAAASFGYLDHPVVHGLFWLTAGTTVASAVSYIILKDTYKILRKNK